MGEETEEELLAELDGDVDAGELAVVFCHIAEAAGWLKRREAAGQMVLPGDSDDKLYPEHRDCDRPPWGWRRMSWKAKAAD